MNKDKLTLDVEKIKEVHELKEGCKYIIAAEEFNHQDMAELKEALAKIGIYPVVVVNTKIEIYEVKKGSEPHVYPSIVDGMEDLIDTTRKNTILPSMGQLIKDSANEMLIDCNHRKTFMKATRKKQEVKK